MRLNRFKQNWPFEEHLFFPHGLLGFPTLTRFTLLGEQEERPYFRLNAQTNHSVSFALRDPFPLFPDYKPTITKKDLDDLEVEDQGELILLVIVNMKEQPPTMNLQAPLLIHWSRKRGKQLLFPGDPEFSLM